MSFTMQLFEALRKEESVDKIKKLIDDGADVNAQDPDDNYNTPLHIAVLGNNVEVVELLVERVAYLWVVNSNYQTACMMSDNSKIKAIFFAAFNSKFKF